MSKAVIISLSVILLVGLVAAVTFGCVTKWGKSNEDEKKMESSTKAVQGICQPTDYKDACFRSMANVNTDDPKELVRAAFKSAKEEINAVAHNSTVLQELEKDPKTAEAVRNCKELFEDAMNDLQRSFDGFDKFEWNQKVKDILASIKTWLSAAITYQETCIDGFENTTGDASHKVRHVLKLAMEMSSNGLAIATDMSSLLASIDTASFNKRRLLTELDPLVSGHDIHDGIPYRVERHPFVDQRRKPYLGARVNGHSSDGYIPDWLDTYPFRNRKLLNSGSSNDKGTLFEDDEPDKRRRRLLSLLHDNGPYDEDELPLWLGGDRRWLLQATNLADNLKKMANVVVAKDGSGKYKTIEEALKDIPKNGKDNFIIYIKEGVYKEYLVVEKWMTHVVFVGDGPTKTRITNNKNFIDGTKTFKTATVSIQGEFFMAKDIGFENTAGAIKHQAVALRVQADQTIFYNCHMDGYQDTLYVHTYRQYYRDCRVSGTIDFIFGDAAAFFQNCTFVVRKPLPNQDCIVTAQGRLERHQSTGIIIHKCRFEPDHEYYPVRQTNKAYLGRPWKEYSRTIIMESHIGDFIQSDGWLPWDGDFGLDTCYYSEFNNAGPGARLANRVKWRGVKTISHNRAEKFMPVELFENDAWIIDSGIPYDPTLSTTALAPGMAPAGAPSYSMDEFVSGSSGEEGSSSKDNGEDNKGEKSSNKEHGKEKKKSSDEEHKGSDSSSDHKNHKEGKSSHHDQNKEHKEENSSDQTHKEKSGEQENKGDNKEERSKEGKHKGGNEGGNSSDGDKGKKTDEEEDKGESLSNEDQVVTDAPAPAPAPVDSFSDSKSSTSYIEETSSTVDASVNTGDEKKPVGQVAVHDLERVLMVDNERMHYASNDPEKKPLTILELEKILMASEEEIEHKTSLPLASSTTVTPRKGPIKVDEMERMLMANEDINGETNDEETNQAMSISIPPTIAASPSLSTLAPSSIVVSPSLAPSIADVPSLAPSIADMPSLAPSIADVPSLAPSIADVPSLAPSIANAPSLGPSIANGPSPAPSTGAGPSPSKNYDEEEVHEWLPPPVEHRPDTEELAPAPKPDTESAADALASTLPSTTDPNLGSRFKYEFHFMLSGLLVYATALIL